MTLHTAQGFKGAAVLALQHLFRVARTQGVKWWVAGVAMIPSADADADARMQGERVGLAQAVWRAAHARGDAEVDDDGEDVDAWDRKNFARAFDDSVVRARIPEYDIFDAQGQVGVRAPPCVVVEVDALPRYASIEWACTGLDVAALRQESHSSAAAMGVEDFAIRHPENSFEYRVVEIRDGDVDVARVLSRIEHGTLYASVMGDWSDERWVKGGLSWVPCKRVWGEDGAEIRGVVVGGR